MPQEVVQQVEPAQPAQQSQGYSTIGTLVRVILIYLFIKNFFGGSNKPAGSTLGFAPALNRSDAVSLRVYISESKTLDTYSLQQQPVWELLDFVLPLRVERTSVVTYKPSKAVQNNGSVWVHAMFEAEVATLPLSRRVVNSEADNNEEEAEEGGTRTLRFGSSWPLNQYMRRPKVTDGVNLLSGKNEAGEAATQEAQSAAAAAPREFISFLKPNISINVIDFDFGPLSLGQLQPNQVPWVPLDESLMTYEPATYFNDFWTLKDYLIPVNSTLPELNVTLAVSSIGQMKWMMYLQTQESFSMQSKIGLESNDQDEFKRMLLEGNPYYLALTFAVSILHSIFDVLAFKNDIGFWKEKKSMEGLSIKTIFINCICQVVILLYLLDNETSFVILASSFVGILIEFWKISKAMDVTVDRTGPIPRLRIKDRASYAESDTKKYDDQAIKYLSWALYPCVFAFGVHSLMYKSHKSWYSFVVNTLVGAVYAFGFILMCPQLYLNYKLKSVAHINHRQMTYKFLSTIVDDLMAFAIRMPALHRLSVFRDDLVFIVFLYQRYIYRVDPSRVNEFGWSPEAPAAEAADAQELTAGRTAGKAADGKQLARPTSVSSTEGFEMIDSTETSTAVKQPDSEPSLRNRRPQTSQS